MEEAMVRAGISDKPCHINRPLDVFKKTEGGVGDVAAQALKAGLVDY